MRERAIASLCLGALLGACAGAAPPPSPLHAETARRSVAPAPKPPTPPRVTFRAAPNAPVAQPLAYDLIGVPLPGSDPPSIVAIYGTSAADVWLLGVSARSKEGPDTSQLLHTDGMKTRLVQRDVCARPDDALPPTFWNLRALPDGSLELGGQSPGANSIFLYTATRKPNGKWSCEPGRASGWGVGRFWSELAPFAATSIVGDVWLFQDVGNDFQLPTLHAVGLPQAAAVAPGGAHALLVVGGGPDTEQVHLVEWSGVRWRERVDILPKAVSARDLLALSATRAGAYFAITSQALLGYDGSRFVELPAPVGFEARQLFATESSGVWSFGSRRVWRFAQGVWETAAVPITQIAAVWLSPNGDLWVAGSDAPDEAGEAARGGAVVRVFRLVPRHPGASQ